MAAAARLGGGALRRAAHGGAGHGLRDPAGPVARPPAPAAVAAHGDLALSSLYNLTHIAGSLIVALAVTERHLTAEQAFQAAQLDDLYQDRALGRRSCWPSSGGTAVRRDIAGAARTSPRAAGDARLRDEETTREGEAYARQEVPGRAGQQGTGRSHGLAQSALGHARRRGGLRRDLGPAASSFRRCTACPTSASLTDDPASSTPTRAPWPTGPGLPVVVTAKTPASSNAINVLYAIEQYERAGVAAIVADENKRLPQGHQPDRRRPARTWSRIEELRGRQDRGDADPARRDPDLVIVARTEALDCWPRARRGATGEAAGLLAAKARPDPAVHSKQRTRTRSRPSSEAWDGQEAIRWCRPLSAD